MKSGPVWIKAQLICGGEPALGPGKALLLEAIDREGSISAAGRSLGMSYRRAWLLVDSMNRCWIERLVDTTSGGGHSRGARLTLKGQAILASYRALEQQLEKAIEGEALDRLTDGLREAPLAAAVSTSGENLPA
jgi:molybdate transport system regulatory protein